MAYEVINTKKAAEILGVSYGYVIQLIHKNVITSAYYGAPDGYCGKPGYIIDREEIEALVREFEGIRLKSRPNRLLIEMILRRLWRKFKRVLGCLLKQLRNLEKSSNWGSSLFVPG